ncbi:uncharacterized protein LOC105634378 isoform X2 [Jatropha curcas]|uniref:uncharacterized protein LOC105634378 isoform X1 n=1 Tax=Jatropha curcas TaxID=180498 RepID=UPI0009D6DB44|nr:uncharacterized protein LOC105634378 isoform X1 [Jatropha curcas]XP_037497657.1 uncharacterized protein LOC105634378 isoform X2 [Jatropha curcas]
MFGNGWNESGKASLGDRSDADDASQRTGLNYTLDDADQDFCTVKRQKYSQINENGAITGNNITVRQYSPNPDIIMPEPSAKLVETTPNLGMRETAADAGTSPMKEEYEKLKVAAAALKAEHSRLTKNLKYLSNKCIKLQVENRSIMDEIAATHGPDAIADLRAMKPDAEENVSEKQSTSSG